MTLTTEQLNELKCNYAEMIVDDMDIKTLCQLAVETIEQNMKDYEEEDVMAEIIDLYGEETLEGLMPISN
tara:strand:+ start:261 stop:470 length:210 start_codon:yes stop_codon:yes gene_type:complete